MEEHSNTGISAFGIVVLYGIVTQCLHWAGVVNWPWQAIWGPAVIVAVIWVIAILIGLLGTLYTAIKEKKESD